MKITVVTPTFNSGKYIGQTMESIHKQNYSGLEHIVIDGQSTDNTLEILEPYIKRVHLISEPDKGQSDAINKGFELASGDIVAWQNSDDTYCDDTLDFVASYFQAHPDTDLIYGAYYEIDEEGDLISTVNTKPWSLTKFRLGRFCPVQPTVFWRASVLEKVGKLDIGLNYCMDVDFYSRVIQEGFKIEGVSRLLGSFRVHDESKTQNAQNKKAHKAEYKKVLSSYFNHSKFDHAIFEYYQHRSNLASLVKRTFKI